MRAAIALAFAALLISPTLSHAAAANAGADKMKVCAASWKTMSADQKKATTYKKFSADCMAGKTGQGTTTAPAMTGTVPAHSSTSMAMDTSKMTPQERMKACAKQWDQMKAEGKTGGMTYKQFSSNCLKKN